MKKIILILSLIISSFSFGFPVNETTTSLYKNDLSEKSAEDVTAPSVDEDEWLDMKKDDILSTSEMNEDPLKDFFVNIRYLEELEINSDEVLQVSSKSNDPASSESIRTHIDSVEENESSEISGIETEVENKDANDENKSGDHVEIITETRRANEGENTENKSGDDNEKNSDIEEENESQNIENKSGNEAESSEIREENEGENIENKTGVNTEKTSETRRANDGKTIENKSSEHSEEVSDQEIANENKNEENNFSKNGKESSEIETMSDNFDNVGNIKENIQTPVYDDDKSAEQKFDNSENEKSSEKIDYKMTKPNDESYSDWDMLDDILDTRRMIFEDDDSLFENVRLDESYDEEADDFRSVPVSEYEASVQNNNYDRERIGYPVHVNSPNLHAGPARRGKFFNPNIFTIQHVNPLDFNSIVSRYGANILRNNRLRSFARRNDLNYRAQDLDRIAEAIESMAESIVPKTMADFESEQMSNAYPYTPLVSKISQESVPNSRYDDVMLKLIRASEKSQSSDNLSWENANYRGRFNNFRPNIVIPPRFGLYKIFNI